MSEFFFKALVLKWGRRALHRVAVGAMGWLLGVSVGVNVAQAQSTASPGMNVGGQVPAPITLALVESLSGPFANTGEAVHRNVLWAVERVNQRGGVRLAAGTRPLARSEEHTSELQSH